MVYVLTTLQQCKYSAPLETRTLQTLNHSKRDSRLLFFLEVYHLKALLIVDELETLMWETGKTVNGAKEIIFETRVKEKAVLGNGRALIVSSSGKARF